MNNLVNLQQICKVKEVKTINFISFSNDSEPIDEINDLLSKGWIILKIYKVTHQEQYSTDNEVLQEALCYVLGFPKNGICPVADKHREEFSL